MDLYISPTGNTILGLSNKFVYEKYTYVIQNGLFNLENTEILVFDKPLKEKYLTKYSTNKIFTILTTLEWVSAPMSFLLKNNFSLLDKEEYINEIKFNRKNKK